MRTMIAAVIGALAVGVVTLAYSAGGRNANLAARDLRGYTEGQPRLVSDRMAATGALYDNTTTGPVLVQCEPDQRALIGRIRFNGEEVNQVECVRGSSALYVDQFGRPVASDLAGDARLVRTTAAYPVVPERRVVTQRQVVYRETPRRGTRSWQKTAMIIGGSAGTGAGIGAIAGGKKGALIGAAIGGGAATIYEAAKRR